MKGTHLPAVTLHDSRIPGYWCCKHSDGVGQFVSLCVTTPALLENNSKPRKMRKPVQSCCEYQFSQLPGKKIIKIYIYTGIPVSVEPLRFFQGTGLEELNFYMWHFINPPIKTPP